ncbi:uncharacterized protein FFNC_15715 [Fusarium fujikuroi]|nr:uncharacterized protein FFNC_15715 [Fusarium fujikuroi]
MIYKDYTIYF